MTQVVYTVAITLVIGWATIDEEALRPQFRQRGGWGEAGVIHD